MTEHLADMFASSPAESVHALDLAALRHPSVTFFTARGGGALLGCGALTALGDFEGEVKSMRTAVAARGRGIASLVLAAIVDEARGRGYRVLRLETGSQDFFAPARALYGNRGFIEGPPFGDYVLDPSSVFMSLHLR